MVTDKYGIDHALRIEYIGLGVNYYALFNGL